MSQYKYMNYLEIEDVCPHHEGGCKCIFVPNVIMWEWKLSLAPLGCFMTMIASEEEVNINSIKKEKGIGPKKFKKVVDELTAVHPKYKKPLIVIENEIVKFVDILQENLDFMRDEYPKIMADYYQKHNLDPVTGDKLSTKEAQ